MKVDNVMTRNPTCCVPSDSIIAVAQNMLDRGIGAIPVVSDQNSRKLIGIITDRDIVTRVVAQSANLRRVRAEDVMTKYPLHCRPDEPLSRCEEIMQREQVRRVPVIDSNERCVGIVAQADIARHAGAESVKKTLQAISEPAPKRQALVA
jgi:CBS domain-containing protein